MRFKVIDDQKVKDLIEKKEKLASEVQDITKQIEELEEKRNKIVLKIQRYNDKALPLIKEYENESELGEFEQYSRVYSKDGELRLEIFDALEEFKVYYKQQQEEAKKKKDDKQSGKDKGDSR